MKTVARSAWERGQTIPTRIQVTAANAKTRRSTDRGLKSARGASTANHDRVLGKSRFRTCAPDCKGTLVAVVTPDCSANHSRQLRSRPGDDLTYGGTTCAFRPCNHRTGRSPRAPRPPRP